MMTSPASPTLVRWRQGDEKVRDSFRIIVSLRPAGTTRDPVSNQTKGGGGVFHEGRVKSSGRLPALCSVHLCELTVKCDSSHDSSFMAVWVIADLWGRKEQSGATRVLHHFINACTGYVRAAASSSCLSMSPSPRGFSWGSYTPDQTAPV